MIEYMVKLCFLYNTTNFLTKIGFSDENAKAIVEAYKTRLQSMPTRALRTKEKAYMGVSEVIRAALQGAWNKRALGNKRCKKEKSK